MHIMHGDVSAGILNWIYFFRMHSVGQIKQTKTKTQRRLVQVLFFFPVKLGPNVVLRSLDRF